MIINLHPAYLLYPARAEMNRILPKGKFYEYGSISSKVREYFVSQVEKITLKYVLASATSNLPPKDGVSEFHVFSLELKTPELNLDVLRCIDEVWHFPVIFELLYDGKIKVVSACKRVSVADASRWVCSDYFSTGWLSGDIQRTAMPLALDLGNLYEQVLKRLIPLSARPLENLADLVARSEMVSSKQRDIDKTVSKLAKEKQFNRKVEINASLRQLKIELEQLSR